MVVPSPPYDEMEGKRDGGEHATGGDNTGVQQKQQQYHLRGGNESDKIDSDHGRAAEGTRSREEVLPSADQKSNAHVAFQVKKRVQTRRMVIGDDDYGDASADERHLGNPRRRRLSEGKNDTRGAGLLPLHAGFGTHYISAAVGTPPQTITLIVDTGSSNTAFPCSGCQNLRGDCRGGRTTLWDPAESTTATVVGCGNCHGQYFKCDSDQQKCTYKQSYSEGSRWQAYQVSDLIRLGGVEPDVGDGEADPRRPSAVHFGCITQQTGMLDSQKPDGIMGLGPSEDSVVWHLAETKAPEDRVFSLCLSPTGGTMVIGGYDTTRHLERRGLKYTPSAVTTGWFSVNVVGVAFGGTRVSDALLGDFHRGMGTIFDSGTTDTYLPKSLLAVISEAWAELAGQPFEHCEGSSYCMNFTEEQVSMLPVLVITLDGGLDVTLTPATYMDPDPSDTRDGIRAYAPRIYATERSGAVLGANIMMNKDVVFDVAKSRIGVVEARCDFEHVYGRDQHAPPKPGLSGDVDDGDDHGRVDVQAADTEREAEKVKGHRETAETIGKGVVEEWKVHKMPSDDCVFEMVLTNECDAECPSGLRAPRTVQGLQLWRAKVVHPARANGKPCPADTASKASEVKECFVDCPAATASPPIVKPKDPPGTTGRIETIRTHLDGAVPDSTSKQTGVRRGAGGKDGGYAVKGKDSIGQEGEGGGCSAIVGGVWGPCEETCEQERYLEDDCAGKREIRPCRIGNLCSLAKQGVVASVNLQVVLDNSTSSSRGKAAHKHPPASSSATTTDEEIEMNDTTARYQLVIADALAEAVVVVLGNSCRISYGDVDVSVGDTGIISPTNPENDRAATVRTKRDLSGMTDHDNNHDSDNGQRTNATAQVTVHMIDLAEMAPQDVPACTATLGEETFPQELTAHIAQPGGEGGDEDLDGKGEGVGDSVEIPPVGNGSGVGRSWAAAVRASTTVLAGGKPNVRSASQSTVRQEVSGLSIGDSAVAFTWEGGRRKYSPTSDGRVGDSNLLVSNDGKFDIDKDNNASRKGVHGRGDRRQAGGLGSATSADVAAPADGYQNTILVFSLQLVGVLLVALAMTIARRGGNNNNRYCGLFRRDGNLSSRGGGQRRGEVGRRENEKGA